MIKRIERGWAGHFICADRCKYRRNTLLTDGINHIVISTVGAFFRKDKMDTIGAFNRYYETMIFIGKKEGEYIEADCCKDITNYVVDGDWKICAESVKELPEDVDNVADAMHERAVKKTRKMFHKICEEKGKYDH